ncbi:hypothetical protein AHAS_Ahas18G0012700 [Arachis hypogaea]|uniref:Late embryogenesis abundant protein LEA-2 subgroup domain-containing protein n=2 Tax=Arachis TaxID=3817 RepID=A0A445CIK4_ARAHY|nr:hypothetical protein Ahy_A07g037355 [Arachis hypogaea]
MFKFLKKPMGNSNSKSSFYTYLLRKPRHDHNQNPVAYLRRWHVTCTVGFLLFLTTTYVLWPSDPALKIVGLKLKRIKVHPLPHITVDISMLLTVRVHNAGVYSLDFGGVDVAVSYRGKRLGHVISEHGHVSARGSSYVDADVEFAGIAVVPEMMLFLEDLAKGAIPFFTVSQVNGQMGLAFFHFPIQAKLSCEVLVSTVNQTIIHQHCLHEGHIGKKL